MKKVSAVALLLVCLALPIHAAPAPDHRDGGESLVRESASIQRVVRVVKKLRMAAQSWLLGTPKP